VSSGKLTLPIGTTALPVRVEAEGYEPYEGELVPDRSRTVTMPPLVQKAAVEVGTEPGPGERGAGERTQRSGDRGSRNGSRKPDKDPERTSDRPPRPNNPERTPIETKDPFED
jgi:hypothetical protein